MSVFVDTSALYAVLDRSDGEHAAAALGFSTLRDASPVTHNYVLVERIALTQARLGLGAVRRLLDDLLPAITVEWVGVELHGRAAAALLASDRHGGLMLVHRRVTLPDRPTAPAPRPPPHPPIVR